VLIHHLAEVGFDDAPEPIVRGAGGRLRGWTRENELCHVKLQMLDRGLGQVVAVWGVAPVAAGEVSRSAAAQAASTRSMSVASTP
jgi:hypothetical protein